MACFNPINVRFFKDKQGKTRIVWKTKEAIRDWDTFHLMDEIPKSQEGDVYEPMMLPCRGCKGCRLAHSKEWAMRCYHEASMYNDNCFVTLTVNEEFREILFPGGSLNRDVITKFLHRLRSKMRRGVTYLDVAGEERSYSSDNIRYFYCGEYGPLLGRPHFHVLLFNVDFPDKYFFKMINGKPYYRSDILESIWADPKTGKSYGYSSIGEVTYESAAYVARYCFKKVTGKQAKEHYTRYDNVTGEEYQVKPEWSQGSNRPGLGKPWLDEYGLSEVYPSDKCPYRTKDSNTVGKPPRYYDKLLERQNPQLYEYVKAQRKENMERLEDDNIFSRLKEKEEWTEHHLAQLVRTLESN